MNTKQISDAQIQEIKDMVDRLEDMASNDIAPLKEERGDFEPRRRINAILDGLV